MKKTVGEIVAWLNQLEADLDNVQSRDSHLSSKSSSKSDLKQMTAASADSQIQDELLYERHLLLKVCDHFIPINDSAKLFFLRAQCGETAKLFSKLTSFCHGLKCFFSELESDCVFRSFPFVPPPPPPSLVSTYYLHPPDARAIFLPNFIYYVMVPALTGGAQTEKIRVF